MTFTDLMAEADQSGNTIGMSRPTYRRARMVWMARESGNPDTAARAQKLITELDAGTITTTTAYRLMEFEPARSHHSAPAASSRTQVQDLRRIAATMDGLAHAISGLGPIGEGALSATEAAGIASRLTESRHAITTVINKLRRLP